MNIFAYVSLCCVIYFFVSEQNIKSCNWRRHLTFETGKKDLFFPPMGNSDFFDDDVHVLANVYLLGSQFVQHFRKKRALERVISFKRYAHLRCCHWKLSLLLYYFLYNNHNNWATNLRVAVLKPLLNKCWLEKELIRQKKSPLSELLFDLCSPEMFNWRSCDRI